jgi:hypothetical protein
VTSPGTQLDWIDNTASPVPRIVNIQASSANKQLVTGVGLIQAVKLLNPQATTAARVRLFDGTDTTGQLLASLAAPAGLGDIMPVNGPGIPFNIGIWLQVYTGSPDLIVIYLPLINHM